MEGDRFDDLTRSLAERPSRRKVLGAMLGAVTAGLASAAGRGVDAAPRCKRVGQACLTSADCCPGALGNGNVWCAPNGKKAKICQACPTATPTACNGACVNSATDNANCGTCGNVCPSGTTCAGGACRCADAAKSVCNGACVDKSSDDMNCGSCGTQCFGGSHCLNGACQCPAGRPHRCADGACRQCCDDVHCDGIIQPSQDPSCCAGVCVGTRSDEGHCGSCDVVCTNDDICFDGRCCGAAGSQCCKTALCNEGLICDSATHTCGLCVPRDSECSFSEDCCNTDACFEGACVACVPDGQPDRPNTNTCCSGTSVNNVCRTPCPNGDTDCPSGHCCKDTPVPGFNYCALTADEVCL